MFSVDKLSWLHLCYCDYFHETQGLGTPYNPIASTALSASHSTSLWKTNKYCLYANEGNLITQFGCDFPSPSGSLWKILGLDSRFLWSPWGHKSLKSGKLSHSSVHSCHQPRTLCFEAVFNKGVLDWIQLRESWLDNQSAIQVLEHLKALGWCDYCGNISRIVVRRYPWRNTALKMCICDILITQGTGDINGKANSTHQASSFLLQLAS